MAKGYWIVHVDVTDPDNYPRYIEADNAVFAEFSARMLVRGGRFEAPETAQRTRHVVIEFDSYEAALACYHSPGYQAAAKLRQAFSQSDVIIVEGVE